MRRLIFQYWVFILLMVRKMFSKQKIPDYIYKTKNPKYELKMYRKEIYNLGFVIIATQIVLLILLLENFLMLIGIFENLWQSNGNSIIYQFYLFTLALLLHLFIEKRKVKNRFFQILKIYRKHYYVSYRVGIWFSVLSVLFSLVLVSILLVYTHG